MHNIHALGRHQESGAKEYDSKGGVQLITKKKCEYIPISSTFLHILLWCRT